MFKRENKNFCDKPKWKRTWKRNIYVCVCVCVYIYFFIYRERSESVCHTAATNNIVYQLYFNKIKFLKINKNKVSNSVTQSH